MASLGGDDRVASPTADAPTESHDERNPVNTITTGDTSTASSPPSNLDGAPASHVDEILDEETALKDLGATARDQDDVEREISHQANLALIEAEDNKDKNRIQKAESAKLKLLNNKKEQQAKLRKAGGNAPAKEKVQREIARLDAEIDLVDKDIADFNTRIEERHQIAPDEETAAAPATGRLPGETQREFLIRTGKITPFAKIGGQRPEGMQGDLADAIIDAEDRAAVEELENEQAADQVRSHQNLRLPGFVEDEEDVAAAAAAASEFSLRPRKKRKVRNEAASDDEFDPESAGSPAFTSNGESEDYDMTDLTQANPRKRARSSKTTKDADDKVDFSKIDDGNEAAYQRRLLDWVERRSRARRRRQEREGSLVQDDGEEEWYKPSPDHPDHHFENGLKLPGDIYPSLFDYQKTGVQWLAELYDQEVGGIVGDEMGLGKTVQVISFIAALHYSKKLTKPVIVVAPATVLQQWVSEFHRWWPALRVSILHSSGSGMLNVRNEGRYEEEEMWQRETGTKKSSKAAKNVVGRVVKHGHVLVTTYAGLQIYSDILIPVPWEVAVLDEGHKIRNPNTEITIHCKELLTPNRIILSGTPMQNNLIELWSLFDFINPMRLGSLVAFRQQFEIPIRLGGYANATRVQMMTAQKCAETLKDAISPYLLQRTKKDVAADLPEKSEKVLFCKLTSYQRDAYEAFLRSDEMTAIMNQTRNPLFGIDYLRKLCNHPDLAYPNLRNRPGYEWGSSAKAGKMLIVKKFVYLWKNFGHKTLLFCQTIQMLDIMEAFFRRQGGINFLRMDGKTAIKERQKLVDKFNTDPDIHLFLLTTRVGGLGTNLTGASRVIIYDPDWNPSTDIQARERAWRLGQKKEVAIYRLVSPGCIEEKIYQRGIFKMFIADKVLRDPKQRSALSFSDLHDLFTLESNHSGSTETSQLFKGSQVNSKITPRPKITPGGGNYDLGDQRARMEAMAEDKEDNEEVAQLLAIDGVAGMVEYTGGDNNDSKQEEDRIMAAIFAKGVHEVLEHDKIVNGKKVVHADSAMLQREANRVAAEAAEHLRRSGEHASHVPIGTVTWTGELGDAGRPRPTNVRGARGGPGSSGVLAGIRGRQGLGDSSASSSRSGTPLLGRQKVFSVKDFKQMIPEFIRRQGGKAPTGMMVAHFNPMCTTPKTKDAFMTALNTVAKVEYKGSTGRGYWNLLPDYK